MTHAHGLCRFLWKKLSLVGVVLAVFGSFDRIILLLRRKITHYGSDQVQKPFQVGDVQVYLLVKEKPAEYYGYGTMIDYHCECNTAMMAKQITHVI